MDSGRKVRCWMNGSRRAAAGRAAARKGDARTIRRDSICSIVSARLSRRSSRRLGHALALVVPQCQSVVRMCDDVDGRCSPFDLELFDVASLEADWLLSPALPQGLGDLAKACSFGSSGARKEIDTSGTNGALPCWPQRDSPSGCRWLGIFCSVGKVLLTTRIFNTNHAAASPTAPWSCPKSEGRYFEVLAFV